MADKKISQLTGASTPLAGTEALPIVQSGSTVKVASDDLTVKNVRSNATTGILQVAGPAAAATRTMTVPDANFTVARTDAGQTFTGTQTLTTTGNSIASFDSTNANGGYVRILKSGTPTGFIGTGYELFSPAGSSTDLGIRAQDNLVFSAGGGTEGFRLNTSGNIVIKTAGKGIDFSANTGAAGETSSLLDWYEEGTFTPVIYGASSAGSGTYTTQVGEYTRIGNRVFFLINIAWSAHTGTGSMRLNGFPFASSDGGNVPFNVIYQSFPYGTTAGTIPSAFLVSGATPHVRFAYSQDDNTIVYLNIDSAATFFIAGSYKV